VALPILGGTLPLHVFTDVLGIPCLWIPAANSNGGSYHVGLGLPTVEIQGLVRAA
jgi:hypothetical protein